MRRMVITLLALGVFAASTALAANPVRISQVYGGNGTTGSFNQDYVELFNSGGTDVDLSGWAIEYSSSAATAAWGGTGSTWQTYFVFPSGATIKPCSYLLLGCALTVGGTSLPVTPDYSQTTMNLSGTAGRVGLFNALFVGTICTTEGTALVDKVAYGNDNCPEGATGAPVLTNILADFRGNGGMDDTDVNSADFATGTPAPRSSTSERDPQCVLTPALPTTWGQLKSLYR
jgi:hypothetical protein